MPFQVSKAIFAGLVEAALADLPEQFARFVEEVPIEILDHPTPEIARVAGLERDHLLLGLYRGIPRTGRSVEHSGVLPDVIYLFQKNIERISRSEGDLISQVRKTLLHEIGHHFGLSEDDLDELGYR